MNYATLRNKIRARVSRGWTAAVAEFKDFGRAAFSKKGLGIAAALTLAGLTASACPDSSSSNDKAKCEGELCLTDVTTGDVVSGDGVAKDCHGDGCTKTPRGGVDVQNFVDSVSGGDALVATGDGNAPKPDLKQQIDAKAPQTVDSGIVPGEDTAPIQQEDTFGTGADGGKPPQELDTSYPPIPVDGGVYETTETSTQPPVVEEECGGSTVTKMYQIKVGPNAEDAAVYVGGTLEYNGIAYKITAIDENSDGTVTIYFEGSTDELKTQLFGTYEVTNEFAGTATYTRKVVMEAFGTTFGAVPQRVVIDEKDCSTEHEFTGVITGAVVYVSLNCDKNADGTYSAIKNGEGNLSVNFDAIDGASWVWGNVPLAEGGVVDTGTEVKIAVVLVGSPVHGNPNCLVPKAGIELTYSDTNELEYASNNYTWILAEGTNTGIPSTDGKTITVSVLHAIPKVGTDSGTGVPGEYVGCATLSVKTPYGDFSQTQCSFDEGAYSQTFGPFGNAVTATVPFVKVEPGPKAKK